MEKAVYVKTNGKFILVPVDSLYVPVDDNENKELEAPKNLVSVKRNLDGTRELTYRFPYVNKVIKVNPGVTLHRILFAGRATGDHRQLRITDSMENFLRRYINQTGGFRYKSRSGLVMKMEVSGNDNNLQHSRESIKLFTCNESRPLMPNIYQDSRMCWGRTDTGGRLRTLDDLHLYFHRFMDSTANTDLSVRTYNKQKVLRALNGVLTNINNSYLDQSYKDSLSQIISLEIEAVNRRRHIEVETYTYLWLMLSDMLDIDIEDFRKQLVSPGRE